MNKATGQIIQVPDGRQLDPKRWETWTADEPITTPGQERIARAADKRLRRALKTTPRYDVERREALQAQRASIAAALQVWAQQNTEV